MNKTTPHKLVNHALDHFSLRFDNHLAMLLGITREVLARYRASGVLSSHMLVIFADALNCSIDEVRQLAGVSNQKLIVQRKNEKQLKEEIEIAKQKKNAKARKCINQYS